MMTGAIKNFWKEIRETTGEAGVFYQKTKILRWFTAISLCVLYGCRMTQNSIFVDSEIMMTNPEMVLDSWCGSLRFGLVFSSRLLSIGRLVPILAGILTMVVLWAVVFFMSFCFYNWSGQQNSYRRGAYLFSIVFVSAPCFAEQFLFILQAVQVALAMLFCAMAVFCAGQRIYRKQSMLWMIPAMVLLVWALGTYQAFAPFFIAMTAISFITIYLSGKDGCGLKEAGCFVLLFAVGFIVYYVLAVSVAKRIGASSAYVESMFLWGKTSFSQSMETIKTDFGRVYRGLWKTFFTPAFGGMVLASTILGILCGIRQKTLEKRNIVWLICAWLILDLSPILLTIITSLYQPIRGHLTYALVCAYMAMFLYVGIGLLKESCVDSVFFGKMKVMLECAGLVMLCFGYCLGWKQGVTMCQLWETANEGYVQDVLMANRIYDEICEKSRDRTRTVAFIGKQGLRYSDSMLMGDVIGHSFFQWDGDAETGVTKRVVGFMKLLGLNLEPATKEQYEEVLKSSGERQQWPDHRSVYMENGIICVKLSSN